MRTSATTASVFLVGLALGIGLLGIGSAAHAGTILGTGSGALLGNDLTDLDNVHNEGAYNPPGDYGGFDAEFFSTDEPGFGGGEYSFNVFDNGVGGGGNKWCCNNPGGDGHQLDARILAGQYILTHFTITSSNDSPARDPQTWSILGSNDGATWTPIFSHAGSNIFTARNQVWRFDGGGADFATPAAYSWFRYDVTTTGGNQHALNELEYFGTLPPVTTLTWNGAVGQPWTSGNWIGVPPAFPTAAEDAIVNSGIVTVTGNQAARQVQINGGSVMIGAGSDLTVLNLTAAAGGAVDFQNNGRLTATGNATIDSSTLSGNAILNPTGAGSISLSNVGETVASSITKTGSGTLALPTANTYTGQTNVNEGAVQISSNNALGTIAGGTVVANGASLRLSGGFNYDTKEPVTITGDGIGGSGALHNAGGNNEFDGPVTLAGNARIRNSANRLRLYGGVDTAGNQLILDTDGGNIEIRNEPISGSGSVRKEGNNTLIVFNGADSNYTGQTIIADGELDARDNDALGTAAGGTTVQNGAGLMVRDGRTLADAISITGTGHNNRGAIRSENNSNTLSGTITVAGDSRIHVNNTQLTISGQMTGQNIDKTGTGTLILTNAANNYASVALNDGALRIANAGALGNTSSLSVDAGQALEFDGTMAINIAGLGANGGTLRSLSGTTTLDTPISLPAVGNVTFDGAGDLIVNQPFGNGAAPGLFPGIDETIWDAANTGLITNGDITGNIENVRTAALGPLGASDAQGVLAGHLHYNNDAAVSNRATALGAVGFHNGNFTMLWTSTFTPDENGQWQFRYNRVDDRASMWIDKDQDGVFELNAAAGATNGDERITVRTGCCGGETGGWNGFVSGQEYLLGITMNDTGGGGYFRDTEFNSPSEGWTDLNPSATPGLFKAMQTPDNSVVKTGTGTTTFAGANTYSGTTSIDKGTLIAANSSALGFADGTAASGTTVADGVTLALRGGISIGDEHLTLGGAGAIIHNISGNNSMGTQTVVVGESFDAADQVVIQNDAGSVALGTTGTFDLNYSQLNVDGPGNTTINQKISAQGVGTTVASSQNVLDAYAFNVSGSNGDNNLDEIGQGGGLLTQTPISHIIIDGTDEIDYRNDNDFRNGDAGLNAQGFSVSLDGLPGLNQNDNYATMFTGQVNIPDLNSGAAYDVEFGTNRSDDPMQVYVDLDQDGVFEAPVGDAEGEIPGVNERVVSRNCCGNRFNTISIAPGTYDYMAVHLERGGGSQVEPMIDLTPDALGRRTVQPGEMDGLFTVTALIQAPTQYHLIKNGTGLLRLTGDNDYDGETQVNAGTLLVNGTTSGQGNYAVAGATLGGEGTIGLASGGAVTIAADGTLAPGDGGIGTLGVTGDATILGTLLVELDGATDSADMLAVTGALDITGATIEFDVLSVLDDDAYILASYGSLAGDPFTLEVDLPEDYALDYNFEGNSQIALIASAVPEPSTIVLIILGGLGLLAVARRRRKA